MLLWVVGWRSGWFVPVIGFVHSDWYPLPTRQVLCPVQRQSLVDLRLINKVHKSKSLRSLKSTAPFKLSFAMSRHGPLKRSDITRWLLKILQKTNADTTSYDTKQLNLIKIWFSANIFRTAKLRKQRYIIVVIKASVTTTVCQMNTSVLNLQ